MPIIFPERIVRMTNVSRSRNSYEVAGLRILYSAYEANWVLAHRVREALAPFVKWYRCPQLKGDILAYFKKYTINGVPGEASGRPHT